MRDPNPYSAMLAPYSTHWQQVESFTDEPGCTVLELGCNTGYIGKQFRHASFYGIDVNADAAAEAASHYEAVAVADLNRVDVETFTPPFDVAAFGGLLAGDVLEHLIDPIGVLRRLLRFVEPGGRVVVSVPNVANFRIRLGLLFGSFDYTDTGILDRTHLHLFTRRTALEWFGGLFAVEDVVFGSATFGRAIGAAPRLGPILGNTIILRGHATS